jgi:hypothetical protein
VLIEAKITGCKIFNLMKRVKIKKESLDTLEKNGTNSVGKLFTNVVLIFVSNFYFRTRLFFLFGGKIVQRKILIKKSLAQKSLAEKICFQVMF